MTGAFDFGEGEEAAGATRAEQRERLVSSRPETVTWGWFPIDKPPVLTIRSGDTVHIDALSHAGATQDDDPATFLGSLGVEPEEILQDVLDFWTSRSARPREGRSGHIITGPIYIEDAAPGDILEVQILDLSTRVPYGINNTGPTSGVGLTPGRAFSLASIAVDFKVAEAVDRTQLVSGKIPKRLVLEP